jgi:hypothetical protein
MEHREAGLKNVKQTIKVNFVYLSHTHSHTHTYTHSYIHTHTHTHTLTHLPNQDRQDPLLFQMSCSIVLKVTYVIPVQNIKVCLKSYK